MLRSSGRPVRHLCLVIPIVICNIAIAGQIVPIDGVPHVCNPAVPPGGVQVLDIEEIWRAGGADDEDAFFGLITRVLADDSGRLYVLDSQLQQVHVYSPDGNLERTVFGEGDGPGEVRRASDLVQLADGSLGVVNRFPAALITIDRTGNPGTTLVPREPGRMLATAACRGERLVMAGVLNVQDEDTGTHTASSTLAAIDPNGDEIVRYLESNRHVDYHNDYVFSEKAALIDFLYSFDVGPDGRVYALADRDEYEITVFEPDGSVARVIEREFTPRVRTPAEADRIQALIDRRFRTFPFSIRYEMCANEAVIAWYHRGLQVTGDGELWVRHGRSAEIGRDHHGLLAFDVFDPSGHFQRQVVVPVAGNALYDGVFRVGQDLLVVVHGFVDAMRTTVGGGQGGLDDEFGEPDPPEIVCYRINR